MKCPRCVAQEKCRRCAVVGDCRNTPDAPTDALLGFLAKALRRDRLEEAYARALAISYKEYEGQVFEFLDEEARPRYGTESAWDEMRLRVASLIESVLKRQDQT